MSVAIEIEKEQVLESISEIKAAGLAGGGPLQEN